MIKHLDCFAGAGGFSLALKKAIGTQAETIWFSEIDKFAIQTYEKNFLWVPNFWDISKIDIANLPDFGLLTGGFPCQDVSVAGKQNLEWGRTVLVEYLLQMLEIKKPQYFVFENVKGLMSKKFNTFRNSIFDRIYQAGYDYDVKILNTRDFWIPQNRERVFIVGSYGKLDFEFPRWEELKVFLKDILEVEVEEKFYLTGSIYEKLKKFESNASLDNLNWVSLNTKETRTIERPHGNNKWSIRSDGISPTIRRQVDGNTLVVTHSLYPRSSKNWRWGTGHLSKLDNTSYCLDTGNMQALELESRIRKLTPIECERLQWFFHNWTKWVSNSQRYKQMWNAVSIPPVEEIFKNLLKK